MLSLLAPPESLAVLLAALAIEAACGYPDALYRALGHPVTWIGRLIAALDLRLNHPERPGNRFRGVLALALVLAATAAVSLLLVATAAVLPFPAALAAAALLAASLPAQRSLDRHVAAVAQALRSDGLPAGREAVSHIVGRDPQALDEAAVCRAAIESLAENFSDGVVAPALWLGLAGLPGGALYKAANTADSMIGHRTARHGSFGWAAARFDDLVNWPASRLTAGLLCLAAAWQRDTSAAAAWRAVRRDARRHRSPNAGWPEAAMAGALGLRLAGPRVYGGTRIEDAFMGDGRAQAGPADIARGLALYRRACVLLWGLALVLFALALTSRG